MQMAGLSEEFKWVIYYPSFFTLDDGQVIREKMK